MPNQPKTKHRSVRVPDSLWDAARQAAKAHGETITDIVLRALRAYVGPKQDRPEQKGQK